MIFTKADAIGSLRPKAKWVMYEDFLEWKDEEYTQPTEAEIDAEIVRLQAEYEAKQYQRNRSEAYPSIQEQLDMQYWDAINGTTVWQDTINAIKAKYPKVG
jgi:hypothetical protein